jgi:hypothetical protein
VVVGLAFLAEVVALTGSAFFYVVAFGASYDSFLS